MANIIIFRDAGYAVNVHESVWVKFGGGTMQVAPKDLEKYVKFYSDIEYEKKSKLSTNKFFFFV